MALQARPFLVACHESESASPRMVAAAEDRSRGSDPAGGPPGLSYRVPRQWSADPAGLAEPAMGKVVGNPTSGVRFEQQLYDGAVCLSGPRSSRSLSCAAEKSRVLHRAARNHLP